MRGIPFHTESEDDGHFYALATCDGLYVSTRAREPATIALFFSPSQHFSRFSFQIYTHTGEWRMYHAGPDHSPSADAALLEAWVSFGVPAHAWSLFPRDAVAKFAEPEHQPVYVEARSELCRALYGPRMKVSSQQQLGVTPFFDPPEGGYVVPDAFKPSAENEELLESMVELKDRGDR
jgi:hypothetical protein